MALFRRLAPTLLARHARLASGAAAAVAPVTVTVVGLNGSRHIVRALPGSSLIHALQEAEVDEDAIAFSPEGRGAAEAVVLVPAEVAAALPPHTGDAAAALAELAVDVRPNTRLASAVTLTPDLDGAVLALGKLRPWKTL